MKQPSRIRPKVILKAQRIKTLPDGTVIAADAAAARIIKLLDLNSPKLVEWRLLWMRVVDLAMQTNATVLRQLIGFPDALPELRRLRPPGGNARPNGLLQSWAALKERGELPEHY